MEFEYDLCRQFYKPILYKMNGCEVQIAGFENMLTGEFKEIMEIHNVDDLDRFIELFDISVLCIKNVSINKKPIS